MTTVPSSLKQWFLGRQQLTPQKACPSSLSRILILDGGVSTHLQQEKEANNCREGNHADCCFPYRELWSSGLLLSEHGKGRIFQGHCDWIRHGADVITTVTYQCHYEHDFWPPAARLTNDIVDQMWMDAIELARQAIAARPTGRSISKSGANDDDRRPHFVFASLGCYGAAMANGAEYTGDYSSTSSTGSGEMLTKLKHFHEQKLEAAIVAKPDGIAFETIPSLTECMAIRDVLLHPTCKIDDNSIACYVALACRNERELNDGTPVQAALDVLLSIPNSKLQAVGFNCCDVRYLPGLIQILVPHLRKSNGNNSHRGIVVYPNSGETWDAVHQTWRKGTGVTETDKMAEELMNIVYIIEQESMKVGTAIPPILIGGCCRTKPETIAALRRLVDAHLERVETTSIEKPR